MKRFFALLLFVSTVTIANAQIKLPASASSALKGFTAPPAIGDVGKTSNSITDELTSKLSLTGKEKTGTADAVKGFLGEKQGIMGLAKSNPTSYLSKFGGLQSGLFGKLKGAMGAAKYAKFLKLKPTGGGAGNVLSNLFF